MHNVRRPIFAILNNRYRPDDLGSCVELDHIPPIGMMARLRFAGITAVDDEEMADAQRRFDANAAHPIQDVTIRDFWYTAIGGVRLADLPAAPHPEVPDRLQDPAAPGSENYYPDWSRTTHLDARNVQGLTLENLHFITLYPDERPKMLTESPTVML